MEITNPILFLFYMLFSFGITTLHGQAISVRHYGVDDGISQSEIRCIYQDSEGYLWLATQNGLNKFDGYQFENFFYDPTNIHSISNNWIFDITEDSSGNLWIGTKEGLNIFDKETGHFRQVPHKLNDSVVADDFVYGVLADENNIYINIPPLLSIYNYQTKSLESHTNNLPYDGTLLDFGFPIMKKENGEIWLGSTDGLSVFNPKTKTFRNYFHDPYNPHSLAHSHITVLYEDKSGNILIGTENGLNFYNEQEDNFSQLQDLVSQPLFLSRNYIRSVLQDSYGVYWIGTEEGGLNRIELNRETGYFKQNIYTRGPSHEDFISHDMVYALHEDHSHNLWIGTIAGLDKTDLKPKKFRSHRKTEDPNSLDLLDNVIGSVYIDDQQRLWIGNWANGLNIYDPESDEMVHYTSELTGARHIPNNHVHVLFEDSRARIWMGTRNGVSLFNNVLQSFTPFAEYFGINDNNFFVNNRVYCITEISTGQIWIGSGNGIYTFDPESKISKHFHSGSESQEVISSNLVYSVMEDSEGLIWIATMNGLDCFYPEENKMIHYKHEKGNINSLCDNFTISLCEDYLGNIWIGTSAGINRFNKSDDKFTYFSLKDGLPSNIIYDVIEDLNHDLWFSTGSGLAMRKSSTGEFNTYSITERLQGVEFNLKAVFQAKNGEIYFGGMQGLISFHPDSLAGNPYVPPVVITSFTKERDGEKEKLNIYSDRLELTHKDYSFTLEFAALDYTFPYKNRYAYKMEGLRNEWVDLGNRNFVYFTNLPSGNYTFMVRGTNNDGVWNNVPARIKIRILPPWWKSNVAYIMYVLFVVVMVIVIIILREKSLLREKRLLEKGIRERTAEIELQKERVEESKEKLKSTITSIDDLVFVLDRDGIFQEFYNPNNQDELYRNSDLFLCKHFTNVDFPPVVVEELHKAFKHFQVSDQILEFDYCVHQKNKCWYNAKVSPRRNAQGELSGITIVSRHITSRKEAEEQVRKQKEELDELNATKDKFFSILAHDLKNPFASLYSLSQVLDENYRNLDEKDKIHSLKRIHQSAELIYNLLENLLTWSKSQRGRMDYEPARFNLAPLIQENINLHRMPAEKKGVKLVAQLNDQYEVYADRQMINAVIRNLVNNAVKFTKPGNSVEVLVSKNDHVVQVEVKDDGVGISPEDLKKLFKIDVKFKTTGTAGEKGTGLGLILCHEFVIKNGGKIWCKSQPDQGTSFIFTIPEKRLA